MDPWTLTPALIVLALVFVLAPVSLAVYLQYRPRKVVRCPVTGGKAVVQVDPLRAALGEAAGLPGRRITACSFWPECYPCAQTCLRFPESAMRDIGAARARPRPTEVAPGS
jgi:hypothetical protein